jgi:eukaryotic-like serine/threonine-protein kinase
MNPCANCGQPLDETAHRCPACGALAPPPGVQPAGDESRPPWAIPIREAPDPEPSPREPDRRLLYAVIALVLLAGAGLFAARLAEADRDDSAGPEPGIDGTDPEGSDPEPDEGRGDDDPEGATSSTTTAPSPEASTSTTTAAAGNPEGAGTGTGGGSTGASTGSSAASGASEPDPGSVSLLDGSFRGGWVAQLTSVPTSAGTAAIEAAWREARSYAAGAVVTRSDEWSSLEPGFWVILAPGPFDGPEDARAYCAAIDHRAREDCIPRELTGRRR